jgi:chromosome segregation ATPase
MSRGEERIGVNGAAAVLGVSADAVRGYAAEGRLDAGDDGGDFSLEQVEELARQLQGERQADAGEEIFEGEVLGEESVGSRLPAVPFERYERLLQQGQDYKTRLEERNRQVEEVRAERDAARVEIDRLWSEIERLNLIEFQRALQEKTISTLEEDKEKLEAERERLQEERLQLVEDKASLVEERIRLEAEIKVLKSRGFFARLFGGG